MQSKFTLGFLLFLSALLPATLVAQEAVVWPGDIDDNGRVDGADLLRWAFAFGSRGYDRPNASADWSAQPMGQAWEKTFPDGKNFAYADTDGDSRIAARDLSVLIANQGLSHANPILFSYFQRPDTSGTHEAVLRLTSAGISLTADGTEVLLDVEITGRDSALATFHGVTFMASLPAGYFADFDRFQVGGGGFGAVTGPSTSQWVSVDSASSQLRVTYSEMDHRAHRVDGSLLRLTLPLSTGVSPENLPDAIITVDSLIVHDPEMRSISTTADTLTFTTQASCSFSVDPVCGSDGVTYLNGCFAEAAGVITYSAGACWNPGLDHTLMDPDADCPTAYEPVCAFNGVTYANACAAEAAGVTNYFTGVCSPGDLSCYDPNLIVISNGTTVNMTTGAITLICTGTTQPVCGCDGQQYASACLAEASGVRSYVVGNCNDGCIDPSAITGNDDCGTEPDFVCGCNNETYINGCFAEAAGVLDYSAGPCNGSSNWCAEATVISCGDYLPNETTVGAGNQLTSYPGATSVAMQGTDRVYVFEKTSAGDLQVGLEIMTPGLNMDLFLLTGDCNNYQVVGSSTYSNNQTNNEGIVLEDAPNGTYYIVVDAPFAGPGGDYRLELSCGYLDCSQRVPLSCGVTYNGTNAGGADDVSTYTCGNTLNVENNGPEIVHSFTITESGPVTITLAGMTANLELFLLSECSRRSCLAFSQNPGSNPEVVTRTLPAGTYYVVVDGYNGAVSDYALNVDCSASCAMTMSQLGQENASCGQATGSITFQITGGNPVFSAHYVGPVCRAATSSDGVFHFDNLPPGTYVTYIEDALGCEMAFNFTIGSDDGGMAATMTAVDAGCGQAGGIGVNITAGGTLPYTVYLSGDASEILTTTSSSWEIGPLAAGTYTVLIQDANGCSVSQTVVVEETDGGMNATATGIPAGCDGTPGRIYVQAPNGTLPYVVHLSGPVSGGATVNGYNFHINDLLAGQYQLTLTDAFGCTFVSAVTVGTGGDMDVQISATPANCGIPGAALVTIGAGQPPFMVNYSGPVTGSETISGNSVIINDLPAGTYSFSIWDDNGCDVAETVFVEDGGGNLDFSVTQLFAACNGEDSGLQLLINGGTPNYTVTYTGTVSGSMTIGGSGSAPLSLPAGTYTFTATDFGGCSATYEMTVTSGISSATQQSFAFGAGCGQIDNIRTLLNGGEGPFEVTVTADACPDQNQTFTTNDVEFDLLDLPNCTYTISVIDGGGCQSSDVVVIDVDPDAGILELEALDGACGGTGTIGLTINVGDTPFFIDWTGPVTGSVNLAAYEYQVGNLPAGTYTFSLINADGCEDIQTITLNNDGSLEVISSIVPNDCGGPDQIWNDIEGGTGPYEVNVTRLCEGAAAPEPVDSDDVIVAGNGFEIINVEPCCYQITVTDANGCTPTTEVCVDPANLFNLIPEDGICGQPGALTIMVMNSNAAGPYQINFTGPATGVTSDGDGETTIQGLPAGTYTVTVTDANGCTETETATIDDIPSDLSLSTALINNECGQYNQLWNDVAGGVMPYTIEVTRLCDNTVDTTFVINSLEFELFDLDECCYKVKVTDALGCMVMNEVCVEDDEPELFSVTPVPGPCGENGRIDLSFTRGEAPYTVTYTGPQSGDNNTVSGNALSINDAPPGFYTFTVTDANGCTEVESTTLEATTNDLVLQAALIQNDCGQYNQIWIDIFNGTGPFNVEVIRLCDGTTLTEFVSGDVGFELFDLPPCDYKIIVVDQAGCMVMDTVTVFPAPVDLFDLETASGLCGEPSLFNLTITRGRAPFTIELNGPQPETIVTSDTTLSLTGLPSGDYTLFVTDSIGCIETAQFTLENTFTDLELVTSLIFNDCNQLNQLWNDVTGGVPPYTVELLRLCDGTTDTTFVTSENEFELFGLMPCEYKVKVTDAVGCMRMNNVQVTPSNADVIDLEINNSCDSSGFHLSFVGGAAPYRVVVAGPITQQFMDVPGPEFYVPAPSGDYMVRVFSANGCDEMVFASIDAEGDGIVPQAGFAADPSGLGVSFTNQSADALTYLWDFGDGTTSAEENPEHVYAASDTYTVCLTATNDCGSDQLCQEVMVAESGNVQIVIGGDRQAPGGTARVPVSIQGATNLATIAGTFELFDPSLATITHVSAGTILPQFNAENNSFSFVAGGNEGIGLEGNIDVLFFLHLDLGQQTGITDIMLANTPVRLEVSTVQDGVPVLMNASYLPGFVEVSDNLLGMLSSLAYDRAGAAIDPVVYNLSEPGEEYSLELPEDENGVPTTLTGLTLGRMYYVEPRKNTDPRNGLSSFEIFLAQRLLLGLPVDQVTDPLQIVGMDMNCSQSFTTTDLLLMQNLLVENISEVSGCDSWTFVPNSHSFPADFAPENVFPAPRRAEVMLMGDSMVMFTGVKTGDLLGDADPGRNAGALPLTVDNATELTAGINADLTLTLTEGRALAAFQGELRLAEGLEFVAAAGALLTDLTVNDRLAERGRLRFSWFSPSGAEVGAAAGAEVVTITVRVTDAYVPGTEPLRFDYQAGIRSVAYAANGDRFTPELVEVTTNSEAFRLLPARPNPAVEQADLPFHLPAAAEVTLSLMDGLGRPVLRRAQQLEAGANRFRLDLRGLPAGTYYYRLVAGDDAGQGKLVVRR